MRKILVIALVSLTLINCRKNAKTTGSVEVAEQPGWTTESFKTDYTIQFPPGYEGVMMAFEGNILSKHNADSTYIWYSYCGPLFCSDFRDVLTDPYQSSVSVTYYYNQPLRVFSNRIEFLKNGELAGVLYHDSQSYLRGTLFWKDQGVFKEAANVSCWFHNMGEVVDILRTIKEK